MTAIGNCKSLESIDLNPKGEHEMYSVRDEEATALLDGLKRNPALERLSLCAFKGFGTPAASKALATAIVQPSCRLEYLNMRAVGVSVEGLAHISAALRDNRASVLLVLCLDGNPMIGDAAGGRHVAGILSHSPALRKLGLWGIGMDDAGAVVIADAVAHGTTLKVLEIGHDQQGTEQQAVLIPLLKALTQNISGNRSITELFLDVTGPPGGLQDSAVEAGLAEAVAGMILSNSSLKVLGVSSFFVTRGLWALAHNRKITTFELIHEKSPDEEELDPLLLKILHNCTNLRVLKLMFTKPYGPSTFTKEFFQG